MPRLSDDLGVSAAAIPPPAVSWPCASAWSPPPSWWPVAKAKPRPRPAAAPPPPQVGVVTVAPGDVGLVTEPAWPAGGLPRGGSARTGCGHPAKAPFTEGSDVKAGQKLFAIDDAPYRASLESARASVAQADANVAQTRALAERYKPLVAVNAISKQEYDNAVASQKTAEANLAAARASVTTAQINVGYAAVTAPFPAASAVRW